MDGGTLPLLIGAAILQPQSGTASPPVSPEKPSVAAERTANEAAPRARPKDQHGGRWFARLGALGAFYHSGANIKIGGQPSPDASARVSNNVTMIFDIGYDIRPDLSLILMAGVPPRPTVSGAGSIDSLGALGEVRYGPVILTGVYKFPRIGRVRPYAGTGVAYAIIVRSHDGAVSHLRVHNDWGFVLQAGAEYRINRRWGLYADVKQVWLSVDADGSIGAVPLAARVRLNPTLVTFGTSWRFR